MRAAVQSANKDPHSIENVPDPEFPGDGVFLKVLAYGVCHCDWHGRTDEHPLARPGNVSGHEHCGEVLAARPAGLSQVMAREVRHSDASAQLAALVGAIPPGIAVIPGFAAQAGEE